MCSSKYLNQVNKLFFFKILILIVNKIIYKSRSKLRNNLG